MKVTAFELFNGRVLSLDTEITKKDLAILTVLVATSTIINPSHALASSAEITDRMHKSSQPLKDILIAAADPVCYVVFAWGFLECMLGKGSSGITRMKYAVLGYLGINWIPVFMEIMRNAKP